MEDNKLTPSTVPGTDAGSIYTVVARTQHGYIGLRRLSKYCYRVRCGRLDDKPLITMKDTRLIATLVSVGIKISEDGKHLSAFGTSAAAAMDSVGSMFSVLTLNEEHPDSYLPVGTDPEFLKVDIKIDAAKAKQALAETAPEATTIPVPDDALKN